MTEQQKEVSPDVFFLGAGFDAEYLQPLMRDIPDDFESLYTSSLGFLFNHRFLSLTEQRLVKEDEELKKDLDVYYRIVKTFNHKMQENIEEIIDFAYNYLPDDIKRVFFCLFHYVFFLRELRYYREIPAEKREKLYARLLEKKCAILTLNYTAFVEKEHPNKKEIERNPKPYFGVEITLKPPCVLKLHGGVMFYHDGKESRYGFTDEGKEFLPYHIFKGDRGNLGQHVEPQTNYSQLIVPPFKNKEGLIKTNQKFEFYRNVWDNAKNELKRAQRLFIIGCSFANDDKDVENLLMNSVGNETEVYVVALGNINKEKIKNLFKNAKQVQIIKSTAAEFVKKYSNVSEPVDTAEVIP